MHATIGYHLANTLITDVHRRAERDQATRAAKRSSRTRQPSPPPSSAPVQRREP
jgi:hypothetical protein